MSSNLVDQPTTKRDRILWWFALLLSLSALAAMHHALNP